MALPTPDDPVEILLVEDNPGDVRLIRENFAETEMETRIHTVTNGAEAIEFLRERHDGKGDPYPDVVLLDLNLPKVDGFEVLELINDDDSPYPPLPVLVLTSSTDSEDVHRAYEQGANAYLTKVVDPTEFESLAREVEEFWFEKVQLPPR